MFFLQCTDNATETVSKTQKTKFNIDQHSERVDDLANGVVSMRRPEKCSKAAGATLDWNGVLPTRTASGGGWRGDHYSSAVLSIAARQIMVGAALKFSQRRSQPSTFQKEWI